LATKDSNYSSYGGFDPLSRGATLVWGSGTITVSAAGWFTIKLDTQFYLPPGMNLAVFWADQDGVGSDNGSSLSFSLTNNAYTTPYRVQYAYFNTWVANYNTGNTSNAYRPVIRLRTLCGSVNYAENNVGILEVIEPKSIATQGCASDYKTLKISLANMGMNDVNFSTDNLLLNVEVTSPIAFSTQVSLNKGMFLSGSIDTITLTNVLPVTAAGVYDIKIWLTAPQQDDVVYDDTLLYLYRGDKIALPVDEDFASGILPSSLVSNSLSGNKKWEVVQGSNVNGTILSAQGGSMLSFSGTTGSMARLSTRQLDLAGTSQPILEFWYAHDTADSPEFMEVKITVDGENYELLRTVYKQDAVAGWKKYEAPLSLYTTQSCVMIAFEAQVNSRTDNGEQNIDRIRIGASQNLKVAEIILPEPSICDLGNQEIKVVIANETGMPINFDLSPTTLLLSITGAKNEQLQYNLIGRTIAGFGKDTITITSNYEFVKGSFNLKAFVSPPIDLDNTNDTAKTTQPFVINPRLAIAVKQLTGGNTDCFKIGGDVHQDLILQNIGNTDLTGIKLVLVVTAGDNYTETVTETETIDLKVGEDTTYTFKNPYIVPNEIYRVQVKASLECDPALIDTAHFTDECIDLHDLSLISLDNPSGRIDTVSSLMSITVTVKNTDNHLPFNNVDITAQIEDKSRAELERLTGVIPEIKPLDAIQFTFTGKYTVPNDSVYFIRVYISSGDFYPEQDTLYIKRGTNFGQGVPPAIKGVSDMGAFKLEQNIPNPANENTLINYSVPEAGEVLFHVHSISGQLLYSKIIEAPRGNQYIELNTATFAAGVYFYSMEYKGQRIVKRMSVR
jgi:hypothetical protein